MFKITSEKELLECFRLIDREEVIIPKDLELPRVVKDYLTWAEPSGHRVYLVFTDRLSPKATPLGIVFRREAGVGVGNSPATMCEWCHSVRVGGAVGLLTATANERRRVGLNLCRDLRCKENVASTPGVHDLPVTQSGPDRVRKVISRMADFARRDLF